MSEEEYTEYLKKRLALLSERILDQNFDWDTTLAASAQIDYLMKELYLISKA